MRPMGLPLPWWEIVNDTSFGGLLRLGQVQRLRDEGLPDDKIALFLHLPDPAIVEPLYQASIEEHPRYHNADYQLAIEAMHRKQVERLLDDIANPGYKYDVKGQPILGPDGTREIDMPARAAFERELSRNLERQARLRGLDAPVRRHLTFEDISQRDEMVALLDQLKNPAAIAAVTTGEDGELIYDPDGPSLELGDGGVVDDEDATGNGDGT